MSEEPFVKELRLMHQRLPEWDGTLIPALSRRVSRWRPRWHQRARSRKRLRDLCIESLTEFGMPESQVHAYVAHAMACVYAWPAYMTPLDVPKTAAPRSLFCGLLPGYDDPLDENLAVQPLYAHGRTAVDPSGAVWRTGSVPRPKDGGVRWSMAGRESRGAVDIEAAQLKLAGMTYREIGLHFSWPLQNDAYGRAARCRTAEEAVKRGRALLG